MKFTECGVAEFATGIKKIKRWNEKGSPLRIRYGEARGAFTGANIVAASTGNQGGNATYGGCSYLTIDFFGLGSTPEIHMFIAENEREATARISQILKNSPKHLNVDGNEDHGIEDDGCLGFVMCGDCEPMDLAYILWAAAMELKRVAYPEK